MKTCSVSIINREHPLETHNHAYALVGLKNQAGTCTVCPGLGVCTLVLIVNLLAITTLQVEVKLGSRCGPRSFGSLTAKFFVDEWTSAFSREFLDEHDPGNSRQFANGL